MIPLNEYPKEELQELLYMIESSEINLTDVMVNWESRIREAISDQEFKEKELPFKTE